MWYVMECDIAITIPLSEPILHLPRRREQPDQRHLASEDGPVRPRGLPLRALHASLRLHDIQADRHQLLGDLLPVSLTYVSVFDLGQLQLR